LLFLLLLLFFVGDDDDDAVEKAWKLTSCETWQSLPKKHRSRPLEINFQQRHARAENSNSRFETLEPVISTGSSVGNDSKTPVNPAYLY
jgi:hypothetical protein